MNKLSDPRAYGERVLPSMSFYVAGLFLPAALFLIALPFSELAALVVSIGSYSTLVLVSVLLSQKIEVSSSHLKIAKATISMSALGNATSIARSEQFLERGQRLSPLAFTRFQIGVKGLVKIELQDPTDPTPYWLVSTRHPEVLAGYLNAKR